MAFGEGVQVAHQAFQPILKDMRVDLRGRNVGMAEQGLHHAEVGAVLQEMAGKGVAQHVGADLGGLEPRGRGELLQFAGEMLAGQMAALAERGEQPFGFGGIGLSLARGRSPRAARDTPSWSAARRR